MISCCPLSSRIRNQIVKDLHSRLGSVTSWPKCLPTVQKRFYSEIFPFNRVPVIPPIDPAIKPSYEIITRQFVANQLYKNPDSYFKSEAPVHYLEVPLQFNKMWGYGDYQNRLSEAYEGINGFLTPVEIFKPFYAEAIANYIIDVLKSSNQFGTFSETDPFCITEVGGGNGTCAEGILDYLQSRFPELYQHTRYEIIDVSGPFHEIQRKILVKHASKVALVNQNFFDLSNSSNGRGFFIGLELLDNLPHDKLVVDDQGVIREIWIQSRPEHILTDPFSKQEVEVPHFVEAKRPLQDHLILDFLHIICDHYFIDPAFLLYADPVDEEGKRIFPPPQPYLDPHLLLWHLLRHPQLEVPNPIARNLREFFSNATFSFTDFISKTEMKRTSSYLGALSGGVSTDGIYFAPTSAMQLLNKIAKLYPNRDLILNDFDEMADTMPGKNAPLVQRTEGNVTTTYKHYIDAPPGRVDIFYPTDFTILSILQYHLNEKVGYACGTKQFMKHYADTKSTRTRTFYNPMLEDFVNTQFFLTAKPPFIPAYKNLPPL